MYLVHYGLNQAPFGITPNPAFFYHGGKRGDILEALVYAVTHGEGIVKVTGEVGSGKTMLCRMLESRLPDNVVAIYLINPTLAREDVLYAIAGELGLATGGKRADEVIRLLQDELIRKHAAGRRTVLLIEEAQAMPLETLEEIRLFSNLETAHNKLLQIVLFGQPELDVSLRLPRMRQLKERITHSFSVPPLDASAIHEYLMFRMRAAGYRGPDIFTREAVQLIAKVSEGITRRISILADKSLLAAYADGSYGVERRHVEAAARDSDFATLGTTSGRGKHVRTCAGAAIALAVFALGAVLAPDHLLPWQRDVSTGSDAASARRAPVNPGHPDASANIASKAAPTPENMRVEAPDRNRQSSRSNLPEAGQPAPVAHLAAETGTPSAQAAQAESGHALTPHLTVTRQWLEQTGSGPFTAQLTLVEADHSGRAERFLLRARATLGSDSLYVYPSRVGGISRWGITYGSFASRAEALAAIERLSSLGYRPQLRTVAGLREEIARTGSAGMWR